MNLIQESGNKVIAIHQPNYIPWLGYFYKIFQSDVFVFLDDAQFSNKGMHNYSYIKTPQGLFRLKIPIKQKLGDKILEVETRNELNWRGKHLKTFESFYKKTRFFDEVFNDYQSIILPDYPNVAMLNSKMIQFISKKLGFKTSFINASELNINTLKEEKILNICNALNGNIYYSGTGAREYQEEKHFNKQGIDLRYSVFKPFEYSQLWGEFQSNVTIIDYLMNCGYNWEMVLQYQE